MKKPIQNLIAALGITVILGVLIYFCFHSLLPDIIAIFESDNKEESIQLFLENQNSIQGLICLALLQVLQVITIFFPGAAIHIAGGLVYGPWKSFLVCHLTFVFTNLMVFFLGRHHFTLVGNLASSNNAKVKKVTTWINSNDPAYMCMLAYMIPGIPNGFVPFGAIRTNMTLKQFFISVYCGSFIQIFVMCFIGRQIVSGDYLFSIGLIVFMIISIVVLYMNKNRILAVLHKHQKN